LEDQRSLMAVVLELQAGMAKLGDKVDWQLLEQEGAVKDLFAKCGPSQMKPFIAKAGKGAFKVHRASKDGSDVLPQLWRTHCGVRFGLWAFTRHAAVDGFPPDSLCVRCFSREVAAPQLAEGEIDASASSACGGSGASE